MTTDLTLNIVGAVLAHNDQPLPPIKAFGYEYVIGANGLFIRAEDDRVEAMAPVAEAALHSGLAQVVPYARLKVGRVPTAWLSSILQSAVKKLPNEAMYQFLFEDDKWKCIAPKEKKAATPSSLDYEDRGETVIDLHSHAHHAPFFSTTDDDDEKGLRFYCVIGNVDTAHPTLIVRVGVYGHFLDIPATTIFEKVPTPLKDGYGTLELKSDK